ncbi:MAG: AIR synthase related protein [Christensenellales bacterium]
MRNSVVSVEVEAGAAIGEDCAFVHPRPHFSFIRSITAGADLTETGALCVSVCCNDVAANGGEPVAMTLTIIMTPSSTPSDVGKSWTARRRGQKNSASR